MVSHDYVIAGKMRGCVCSGNVCRELCREDGSLHHHRPQCGHDAGSADQRWQPCGPQGLFHTIVLHKQNTGFIPASI